MRLKITKYHFANGAINHMKQTVAKGDNIVPRLTHSKYVAQSEEKLNSN